MHLVNRTGRHRTLLVSLCTLLALGLLGGASETTVDGNVVAVFGSAVAQSEPPAGWRFEWNAARGIGETGGYRPLVWTEVMAGRRKQLNYAVPEACPRPASLPSVPHIRVKYRMKRGS